MAITPANCHHMKVTFATLDSVVAARPPVKPYHPQHLCLDKGYDYLESEHGVRQRSCIPHIRHRGEAPLAPHAAPRHPARRWVVERTGSWHNRFRKLAARFEKKARNYLALVHLACCLIIYRLTILG